MDAIQMFIEEARYVNDRLCVAQRNYELAQALAMLEVMHNSLSYLAALGGGTSDGNRAAKEALQKCERIAGGE